MSLKRVRDGPALTCLPSKRPETSDNEKRRVFLGSIRVDFMPTHKAFCDVESQRFCYGRCEILKRKISKVFKGTAAIAITAERLSHGPLAEEHPIIIRCNGTAIGSFSGPTAEAIVSGMDSGHLALEGGKDTIGTWSEADFDIFFLPTAGDDMAASDWIQTLSLRCDDFEAYVPKAKRICNTGGCDCCG